MCRKSLPYHVELLEFFAQFVLCLSGVHSAGATAVVDSLGHAPGEPGTRGLEGRSPGHAVGTVRASNHVDGTCTAADGTPLNFLK